jgi:hypothetical protein
MNGSSSEDSRECSVVYAWDLLNCLSNVINSKLGAKHVDVVKYFDKIIPSLYELVITAASAKTTEIPALFRDRRLLGIVGKISEKMMWELNPESVIIMWNSLSWLTGAQTSSKTVHSCILCIREG